MADEDYWEQSNVKGYSFNDNEPNDQLFGVPLYGAARLSQQLKAGLKLDSEVNTDSLSGQHGSVKGAPKYDLLQLISEKTLNAILEADSDDVSVPQSTLKVEEEVRILRRQIESRWDTPEPSSVVQRIILGQPYSLELFKSLHSKKELLDAAISYGDGDAILEVALFLSETLKKSLFQQIMFNCPTAVSHYIHYLSTKMQIQEASDLLELLGRHKDAAYKQFIVLSANPQRHLQRLKNLGPKYFFDSKDKVFVDNLARLVERQMEMKEEVGQSLVATLRSLCTKHWGDNTFSPANLGKEHCVSDKQFQWTALSARATQKDWDSIRAMLISKGWLGSKKVVSAIPMDQIVIQLHSLKAPDHVLCLYLDLVEDVDTKLSLAKKFHCHKIIIDTFASQRDRLSLKSYMSSLSPQGDQFLYAESILCSNVKWKN